MSMSVRLNLGCGDKILEGYANIDVASERAKKFLDNSADEILAAHVVEHF